MYLGKFGIHALAARSAEDAICVYLQPCGQQQQEAIARLREEVRPHNLIVVHEEPPTIKGEDAGDF